MLILFLPSSLDGLGPVDRRRFLAFVKNTVGYKATFDIKAKFDLIFCAGSGDINLALELKETGKPLIYDYANHYLEENITFKNYFRPAYFSLSKKYSFNFQSYYSTIRRIIQAADAVTCSSEVQKRYLERHTSVRQVHVLTDFFENDFPHLFRDKFLPSNTRNHSLFWEGQAENLKNFDSFEDHEFQKLKIDLVTDPQYRLGFFKRSSKKYCERMFDDFEIHNWSFDAIISRSRICDIGIIPINKSMHIYSAKPENKAILMFLLGLPVIASSIPSYSQLFEYLKLDQFLLGDALEEMISALSASEQAEKLNHLNDS